MIKLNEQYVTEQQTSVGGTVQNTVTTDTLYITQFAIDLNAKSMNTTVEQGTLVDGVFQSNLPAPVVSATFDGQLTLSNGKTAALPTAAEPHHYHLFSYQRS